MAQGDVSKLERRTDMQSARWPATFRQWEPPHSKAFDSLFPAVGRRGNPCVADSALDQAGLSRVNRGASAGLRHFAEPLVAEIITEIDDAAGMSSAIASCSESRVRRPRDAPWSLSNFAAER